MCYIIVSLDRVVEECETVGNPGNEIEGTSCAVVRLGSANELVIWQREF